MEFFVKSFHTEQDQRLTSKASGTEFKSYIRSTIVVLKEKEGNFPESTEWCKKSLQQLNHSGSLECVTLCNAMVSLSQKVELDLIKL